MVSPVLPVEEMERVAQELFDRPDQAHKAAGLLKGGLEAQSSPRLSDISQAMPGNPEANDTAIQRFLEMTEPQDALLRLFDEEALVSLAIRRRSPESKLKRRRMWDGCRTARPWAFGSSCWLGPLTGGRCPVPSSPTRRAPWPRRRPPAIWSISGPFGRSRSCWARSPWGWIGSSATRGCFRLRRRRESRTVVRLNLGTRPTLTDAEGNQLPVFSANSVLVHVRERGRQSPAGALSLGGEGGRSAR